MIVRWLRGLALLRHPELIRELGEQRFRLLTLADIRRRFPSSKIARDVDLAGFEPSRLDLGQSVTIGGGTVLAFGDEHNGYGTIRVGTRTWIGQYNNLRACADGNIEIGEQCLISQFCTLVASNHAMARDKPIMAQPPDTRRLGVTLEDDVWLGAGVAVMPAVRIGQGAVIGANSVVTRSVPPYEIWAGAPARRIGERT